MIFEMSMSLSNLDSSRITQLHINIDLHELDCHLYLIYVCVEYRPYFFYIYYVIRSRIYRHESIKNLESVSVFAGNT